MQRLKFAIGLVALAVVSILGGLILAATALPLVAGWERVVLTSGSMQPLIDPGDVVLTTKPVHPLDHGEVIVFKNPTKPGSFITHRVVENLPDGSYRTKGDANAQADVFPVTQENVVGRGVTLVPAVGLPVIWARQGHPVLAGAVVMLVLLLACVSRYALLTKYDPWLHSEAPNTRAEDSESSAEQVIPLSVASRNGAASALGSWQGKYGHREATISEGRRKSQWLGTRIAKSALSALLPSLLIVTVTAAEIAPRFSAAAFTAHTANSGNTLRVPCKSSIVTANADTFVEENLGHPQGTSVKLHVAAHAQDQHTLLRFPVSAIPSGCTIVAATLRLYSTSSVAGRTIEAAMTTDSWSEATTTWSNHPNAIGSPATSPSGSGVGWREWTVTEQTLAMASTGKVNFRLRDAGEATGTKQYQEYSSREGTNPPQLVLTLN